VGFVFNDAREIPLNCLPRSVALVPIFFLQIQDEQQVWKSRLSCDGPQHITLTDAFCHSDRSFEAAYIGSFWFLSIWGGFEKSVGMSMVSSMPAMYIENQIVRGANSCMSVPFLSVLSSCG
jgi:hypothetical protein